MFYLAWFVMGFCVGVCASIGITVYLGHREIKKRSKRSQNWQKIKKELDKENMKEWDI